MGIGDRQLGALELISESYEKINNNAEETGDHIEGSAHKHTNGVIIDTSNYSLGTTAAVLNLIKLTLENHFAALSDRHSSDDIDNDSLLVIGADLTAVVDSLQTQINAIVVGGTEVDPRLSQAMVDFENTDWTSQSFKALQDFWQERIVKMEIVNSEISSEATTQDHITSQPVNTVSGGSVEITAMSGLSAVQLLLNVVGSEYIPAGTNSKLKLAKDGTLDRASSYDSVNNQSINVSSGVGYFIYTKVSEDILNATPSVGLNYENNLDTVGISYGGENEAYAIVTSNQDSLAQPFIRESNTATTTPTELISFLTIPITGNLANLTADQLAYMARASQYWEGIRSVVNPKLISRGKNKFDKTKALDNEFVNQSGVIISDDTVFSTDYISVKSNMIYIASRATSVKSFFTIDKQFISYSTSEDFTTPVNCAYMKTYGKYVEVDKDAFMVVEGATLGSYEPYQSDDTTIVGEFRSLPNGVSDGVEWNEARTAYRKVERVGNRVLTNSDIYILSTTTSNVNYAITTAFTNSKQWVVDIDNSIIVDSLTQVSSDGLAFDNVAHIGKFASRNDYKVLFVVHKGLTLDEVNEMYQGTQIIYELEKPVFRDWQYINLTSYSDGDIILTSDSGLIPEITFTTPLNQGAVVEDTMSKVEQIKNILGGYDGIEKPAVKLTQDAPTQSVELKGLASPKVVVETGRITNHILPFRYGTDIPLGYVTGGSANGSFSLSDGVQTIVINSGQTASIYKQIQSGFTCDAGDEINLSVKGATTNAGVKAALVVQCFNNVGGAVGDANVFTTTDETLELSFVAPATAVTARVYLRAQVITANIGATVTFEKPIVFINDGKPDVNKYIIGTQDTTDLMVEVCGENLDSNIYEEGSISGTTGDNVATVGGEVRTVGYLRLKRKGTFVWKLHSALEGGNNIIIFNSDKSYSRQLGSATLASREFALIDNEEFIRYRVTTTDSKVTVTEGLVAPTSYIPPRKSQVFIKDNQIAKSYSYENGKVMAERDYRFEKLNGFDWVFGVDGLGYKEVTLVSAFPNNVDKTEIATKYSGKNCSLASGGVFTIGDQVNLAGTGSLTLSIPDTDSGWGETYNPSADEIKAYFNGWVMRDGVGNLYTSGTKYWSKRYQDIGTPTITTEGTLIESGTGVTDCPKELAYGKITETYQLRYELATPVTEEVEVDGVLSFGEGINHISVLSGIRKEKAKPFDTGSNIYINHIDYINSCLNKKANRLQRITKMIDNKLYDDTSNWNIASYSSAYGIMRANIVEYTDYNPDAEYYVTYETLSEENNANLFSAQMSYADSVKQAVEDLFVIVDEIAEDNARLQGQVAELTTVEVYEPTLLNGWENFGGNRTDAIVKIEGSGNISFNGNMKDGATTLGTVIFNIPTELAPLKTLYFPVASGDTYGEIYIDSAGAVKIRTASSTYLSIDSIKFKAGE